MSLDYLRQILESRYGWSPDIIVENSLEAAIELRAQALGLEASADKNLLIARLANDHEQLRLLAEALAVHETWFFRGISQLQDAANHLYEVSRQRSREGISEPLRVLSAPCSTGEEVYSLGILLSQRGLSRAQVAIEGIDLSSQAIHQARLAIYSRNAFREPNWNQPSLLNGIQPLGDKWEVQSEVRKLAEFRVGNLLDSNPLHERYECIFCRNLLIYVSPKKRIELLHQLASWLTESGRLYLSAVEAPAAQEAGLQQLAPIELQIYRAPGRTNTQERLAPKAEPRTNSTAQVAAAQVAPARRVQVFPKTPATASPKRSLAPVVQGADPLKKAENAADAGNLAEAESILAKLDKRTQSSAEALFLRGVIAQARGSLDEAQHAWEQAIYLDPAHGPALQRLWLAASARGDMRLAEQYRRRWLKRRVET